MLSNQLSKLLTDLQKWINSRLSNMPCCGATNVKTAFVLGIIGIVLNLFLCCYGIVTFYIDVRELHGIGLFKFPIITNEFTLSLYGYGGVTFGIVCALMSAILVYGAYVRKHKEILIWMFIAIVQCTADVILFIMLCVGIKGMYKDYRHSMDKTLILCGPNSNYNSK